MKYLPGVALVALLMASCSLFPSSSTEYERPSSDDAHTAADLSACRQQADAVIRRDDSIDQDIGSARDESGVVDNTVVTNMDNFSREKRYRRIVNDCMRQRGYVLPEQSLF
ncbi:MAG: hypothetical protein ACREE7_05770 [Dongiaceae bacterium]